jgi:pimeloyl-ACP methyl ester carboxylesterase
VLQEENLQVDERLLHFAVSDTASSATSTRLIFFHGVLREWRSFLGLLGPLSQRYAIEALDFCGHGKSSRAAKRYRVVDYIVDGVDFVKLRGHGTSEQTVLYGHSLGAMVAAGVAAKLPERISAIILEDPPFHTMGNRLRESALQAYYASLVPFAGSSRPPADVSKELAEIQVTDPNTQKLLRLGDVRDAVSLRYMAHCLRHVDPRVLTPIVDGDWLEGYAWEELFSQIRCPILLLQGDVRAGGMLIDSEVAKIKSLAADLTHVFYPNCGHTIHWSRPTELLIQLYQFIETLVLGEYGDFSNKA